MKSQNERLPRRLLLHCLKCYSLITMLLYYAPHLAAQPSGIYGCTSISSECYSCSVFGNSYNNTAGTTIYDDGIGNYYTDNTLPGFYTWNCGNHFLFGEYTTQATSIALLFSYGDEISPYSPPDTAHQILIINPDSSISGPFLVPDVDNFYPATVVGTSFTKRGVYTIKYYRQAVWAAIASGATTGDLLPDITAVVVLLQPITGISVTAKTICPSFSDTQYIFEVTTTPPLDSLLFPSANWAAGPVYDTIGSSCDDRSASQANFTLNFATSGWSGATAPLSVYSFDTTFSTYSGDGVQVASDHWPTAPPYPDLKHYWIKNRDSTNSADLASYLISTGTNYGQTPIINLTISDGITTYTATPTPLPIEAPPTIYDIDLSNHCAPGSTGATAALPWFNATVFGGTPFTTGSLYTYLWSPAPTTGSPYHPTLVNGVYLDHYNINNPTITSMIPAFIYGTTVPDAAAFTFSATDAIGCQVSQKVFVPLSTSGYDLISRDSHFDLFAEPNNQAINPQNANDIWASPYLWNRYLNDGLLNNTNQPPQCTYAPYTGTEQANYLYTIIRNVGCIDYTNTNSAYLATYWTVGSGPETWSSAWISGAASFPACDGSSPTLGALIATTPLPGIAAGGYTTIGTAWYPPDPLTYFPYCPGTSPEQNVMDLCILSRIVDYHCPSCDPTFGMTIPEAYTGTIRANVTNNNNIVTTNTTDAWAGPFFHHLMFGNWGVAARTFSLQFVNNFALYPGTGVSKLAHYASIKVHLGPLFDIWQAAGGHGTYAAMSANEKSVTFDGTNTMRLDSITIDSGALYSIAVEFDSVSGADESHTPNETVSLRQLYFGSPNTIGVDTLVSVSIDSTYNSNTRTMVYDTAYSPLYDTLYNIADTVYSNYSYTLVPPPPDTAGRSSRQVTATQQKQQDLTVYPVPATSILNFSYTQQASITIKLFNSIGQLMAQQTLQNSAFATFNVANYPPGIYGYQVTTNKTTQSGKVLIGN